jgi:hypothetical protein
MAQPEVDVRSDALVRKTSPILRRYGGSRTTERPAMRTSPVVGTSRPAMMRRSVVLPQPLGPRKEMNSPRSTRSAMSRSAVTDPKFLPSASISTDARALGSFAAEGAAPRAPLSLDG